MPVEPLTVNTFDRSGGRPHRSPPRTDEGDITCTHPDCKDEQLIFKRLCEFNKHMDKHERPYRCNNIACRKNPGFTYAGGLLRHQREVHSMHRTKDPFFCPHSSCNRSAGSGFSRRENLDEHLRRRHSGISILDDTDSTTNNNNEPRHTSRLEPLPFDRKRSADTEADDDDGRHRGSARVDESLKAHIVALEQDNNRIRAELVRRDQVLTEALHENQRLRGILATQPPLPPPPPSLPVHLQYHQPQSMG